MWDGSTEMFWDPILGQVIEREALSDDVVDTKILAILVELGIREKVLKESKVCASGALDGSSGYVFVDANEALFWCCCRIRCRSSICSRNSRLSLWIFLIRPALALRSK